MEHEVKIGSGQDLEHLASQLDRAMATLARSEERLAVSRINPGETVFRDPKDVYHQITLGAVLIQYGLSAHHARALDGLLSMTAEQTIDFMGEVTRLVDPDDESGTVGSTVRDLLELMPGRLDQLGRYAEWRRALDRYLERTKPYLDDLSDEDLQRLALRAPSKKQLHLIRVTCAYHGLAFPAVADRRAAFEWLRDMGANAKYREARP